MTRKQLYREVATYFRQAMPDAKTELHYGNPFQLLVAVILSAQCTDKRINQVTPKLFEDYPNAEAMALATPEVIYEYIRTVSYPNNKAKHLVEMARMLWEKHSGEVPQDLKQLTALPGVGRKTANVILSVVWGEARMAVDTHVFRVSHRLGLVPKSSTTPLPRTKILYHTIIRRTNTHQTFHRRRNPQCTPLAHSSRPIHLHRPSAQVRQMRTPPPLQSP